MSHRSQRNQPAEPLKLQLDEKYATVAQHGSPSTLAPTTAGLRPDDASKLNFNMVTDRKKISRNYARASSQKGSLVRLEGSRTGKGKRGTERGTTGSQKDSRKKKDRSSIFQGPKVQGFFSRVAQDIVIKNVNVPLVPMEKLKGDYMTAPT